VTRTLNVMKRSRRLSRAVRGEALERRYQRSNRGSSTRYLDVGLRCRIMLTVHAPLHGTGATWLSIVRASGPRPQDTTGLPPVGEQCEGGRERDQGAIR
jgi:hypothetical protein